MHHRFPFRSRLRLMITLALVVAVFPAGLPDRAHAFAGGASLNLCGTVTAFTPASASTAGSLTIGPASLLLLPGTTLVGESLLTAGLPQPACVTLTLNLTGGVTSGQITAGV